MDKIRLVEGMQIRTDIPAFKAGDTLKVSVKVVEGDKERLQEFTGLVIGKRGSGIKESFTIRKISNGVGVERIFLLNSPRLAKIEKIKDGKVRRAKLYYIRTLASKAVRQKTS